MGPNERAEDVGSQIERKGSANNREVIVPELAGCLSRQGYLLDRLKKRGVHFVGWHVRKYGVVTEGDGHHLRGDCPCGW